MVIATLELNERIWNFFLTFCDAGKEEDLQRHGPYMRRSVKNAKLKTRYMALWSIKRQNVLKNFFKTLFLLLTFAEASLIDTLHYVLRELH